MGLRVVHHMGGLSTLGSLLGVLFISLGFRVLGLDLGFRV